MRSSRVAPFVLALGTWACARPHFQRGAAKPTPAAASTSSSTSVAASSSASAKVEISPDLLLAAIGCFVGGAWNEALGALGEERTLATTRRCRMLVTDALGGKPDDTALLEKVRTMDETTVEQLAQAIGRTDAKKDLPLFRAVASAAREALVARRASGTVRASKNVDAASRTMLLATDALNALHAFKEPRAQVVALVLAADHLDSARGLPDHAKALAAAPAFTVLFGLSRPANDEWLPYLRAAAKAAGHPGDDEKKAFTGVVQGIADRFDALAKQLPASEEREVALGYAKALRDRLE